MRGNFDKLVTILRSHFPVREVGDTAGQQLAMAPPSHTLGVDLDTWDTWGLVNSTWWLSVVDKYSVAMLVKLAVQALRLHSLPASRP